MHLIRNTFIEFHTRVKGGCAMNMSYVPNTSHRTAGMFSGQNYQGGVLVVDDEPAIRTVVRMTLEKSGYYVVDAEDGAEAIRMLNEGEHPMVIDVIITDIRMPNINGIEAITYFQREYPSVPLIVLTGFPDIDLATQLMKQGITDYLVKPVDRKKLHTAVADAIALRHRDWFA
jgi:two-component system, chemotaxis family, chemotaxis protein CheY